jgi:hypothetical protein
MESMNNSNQNQEAFSHSREGNISLINTSIFDRAKHSNDLQNLLLNYNSSLNPTTMKKSYTLMGKTALKTHETLRSYWSSFGKVGIFFLFLISTSNFIYGQCTNSVYGEYSNLTPVCGSAANGAWATSATDCYAGEYSLVNVTSGSTYEFQTYRSNSPTFTGRYATVATTANVALAWGNTSSTVSISWTATFTGQVRFYTHQSTCVTAAQNSTRRVRCSTPVVALPGENCSNPINLGTLTSPISATTVGYADDIATCRTGFADRVYYIDVVNGATITFQETSNSYDEYEYIGYGSNCAATTQIQCWDNDGLAATTWTNSTGSTQRVWYVQDAWSGSGTFTLSWTVVAPSAGCTGTPAAGTGTITSATGCPSTNFTLNSSGLTTGTGITYQWQTSSSAGGTYTNVGAAGSSLTTSTATTAYYRLKTTCSGSGLVNYSNVVSYTVVTCCTNTLQCYDSYGDGWNGGSVNLYVGGVLIGNYTIATGFGPTTVDFTSYSGQAIQVTMAAGGSFPTEMYFNVLNGGGTPIVSNWYPNTSGTWNGTASCPAPCSGTPSPGNALTSSATVASGSTVNLSLSTPPTGSGLTYQWQSAPTSGGTWANIGGATSATYTATVTAVTWYRCIVTCAGSPGTSTAVQVTLTYCTPPQSTNYACCAMYMSNVNTTSGIANFSNTTTEATASYANYSATYSASQYQGSDVTVNVTNNTYGMYMKVWIDFNDNLSFSDAGEQVCGNGSTPGLFGGGSPGTYSQIFTVPASAPGGSHRMRVRAEYSGTGSPVDACGLLAYGETEDYAFTVVIPSPCSGTPAPGNTLTSSASVASGSTVNLSLSTPPTGTGLTYAWQSGPSNTGPWTTIATTATYTATVTAVTWYRCLVTCSGNTGTATPVQVTLSACIPTSVYGCTDGDVIARVILNTLDNNSGTGCPSGLAGYSNYTSNPTLTTTLLPSSTYNCTVYAGQYSEGYAAWIDYNDDLVFDNVTERIGYSNGLVAGSGAVGVLGSSAVFPITLACTPPAGNHLLRVRAMFVTNGVDVTPCTGNSYGEVEDYMITISAAPACASPGLMTTITPAANSATLTWATNCSAATNFDLQYGPAGFALGTGTILTNQAVTIAAPNASFNLTGLTGGTAYTVYYRANCGGGVTSEWSIANNFSTLAVWTDAWVSMNTGAAVWCPGETRVVTVTVTNTGNMTWTNATPDINIGVKWNAEAGYIVRTDANGLAPGATQTYSLTMTAPLVLGANNLTFDIVSENNFWFSSNANGAGPGNVVYTSPTITISSPTVSAGAAMAAICQGTASAALGGSFGGTATAAVWSGGAGTFANNTGSTPETATYTSSASETGTITLTLTTSGGPCGTVFATKTIDVNANLPASVSIAASASTICAGTSVTFTATPTNGGAAPAYQWKVNGANVGANSTTFISTSLSNNDVVTCLLTSNASPCLSGSPATSNSQTITVNQPSTNISVVNGVNIADGDYLWNGNTSNDGSEASNWYILNNGIYSVASIPPSQTDEVFIINYNNTGTCVSSINSANIPASGTFTSGNIYLGASASMTLEPNSTVNVAGNFINDGLFTPGTGTVNMNGSTPQTIGGSAATTFNNLTINNAAGVTLANSANVNNMLTLTNGKLNLDGNTLTIGTSLVNGTITGQSLSNYIIAFKNGSTIGKLVRKINSTATYNFPIGDQTKYTPLTFTLTSGTLSNASLEVYTNATKVTGLSSDLSCFLNRSWFVEPTGISNPLYDISYSFGVGDYSGSEFESMSPMKLSNGSWYYPTNSILTSGIGQGTDLGTSFGDPLVLPWQTTGTLTWTGLSTFSEFGGAGGSTPLPVELLSFNGTCNEGMVDLLWQTASEFNSSHFDVEKSTDGETWRVLATVPSAGTSNELLTYQTVDNNGTNGSNYYRLRQVDIDGKEKLYDPINVSCAETTVGYFTSYPNPSGNEFQVIVNNKEILGACTLNIVDAQGKVIDQRSIEVKDGINMFVISETLTPGIYFLNITNGTKTTQVIKHAVK